MGHHFGSGRTTLSIGNKWSFKWRLRDVLLQHIYDHGPGALEWTIAVKIVVVMVMLPFLRSDLPRRRYVCRKFMSKNSLEWHKERRKTGWGRGRSWNKILLQQKILPIVLQAQEPDDPSELSWIEAGGWVLIIIIYWLNPTTLGEEYYYCYSHFTCGKSGPSEIKKLALRHMVSRQQRQILNPELG